MPEAVYPVSLRIPATLYEKLEEKASSLSLPVSKYLLVMAQKEFGSCDKEMPSERET
jgi:hypothetical protein